MSLQKILAILSSLAISSVAMPVICYYASWATYRPSLGKCDIEDLDPVVCNYLIYSFVGINSNGTIRIQDPELDINKRGFYRFNALKKLNSELKTLVAIGGWSESPVRFSQVASDPNLRSTLAQDAVNFLKTYGFDGFDVDWEYPTARGGIPEDKDNFSKLLEVLRREFDKHGLILTAAVAAVPSQVDKSYDIPAISKSLHAIHVMTYDLHIASDNVTGENSPLYPSSKEVDKTRNVDASIQHWLKNGAPRRKIVMGIPSYGISYTLPDNTTSTGIGTPSIGEGLPGPFTNTSGTLAYYEICSKFRNKIWDDEQKVPFAYLGNQWVGFDDVKSVKYKMKYAQRNRLGGVMMWSIDSDDFRGLCFRNYPLLRMMNIYRNRLRSRSTK